jgi:hypothetical protein
MVLEMALVYQAEQRLHEVKIASPASAPELSGFFNEACNMTTKYLAWVEYEILQAKKYFDLAKAAVVLEKAPEEYKKFKDSGIKFNEDFREAVIARDTDCQARLDIMNSLQAIKAILEGKMKAFERAHYAVRNVSDNRNRIAAAPNLNGTIGMTTDLPQSNFMGARNRS